MVLGILFFMRKLLQFEFSFSRSMFFLILLASLSYLSVFASAQTIAGSDSEGTILDSFRSNTFSFLAKRYNSTRDLNYKLKIAWIFYSLGWNS